jgi:Cys-tRNA(Pro) deacylase
MLSVNARKVQDELKSLGFKNKVIEIPDSTRTSQEAAEAVGCKIGQIAKSLVLCDDKNKAVLVIASGKNRLDIEVLNDKLKMSLNMANADFVKENTGYQIGGVPPIGHNSKVETYIDDDLLEYEEIWAAAGTSNAVFMLTPDELLKMTGGKIIAVR